MYKKLRFLVILRKRPLWKLENVLVQGVHSAPRLYHDHFHRHRSLDQLLTAAASPCSTPQGVQPNILELFQISKNISIPTSLVKVPNQVFQHYSKYFKMFGPQGLPQIFKKKTTTILAREVFHKMFQKIKQFAPQGVPPDI